MNEGTPIRTEEMERKIERLSPEGLAIWLRLEAISLDLTSREIGGGEADRRTEMLIGRVERLPAAEQQTLTELAGEAQQARLEEAAKGRAEGNSFRWLARQMQKEGLARGIDKEQREKMTVGEFADGFDGEGVKTEAEGVMRKLSTEERRSDGWTLKGYLRETSKRHQGKEEA